MSEMDGSVAPVNGSPIFASPMTISRTMPQPSAMPVPEPTRPSTTACTITVEKTCAGEAPMDRSSAYPRIDSRTIIEKVFAMMNEPTNSAMTAKMRISGWMKPSESCVALVVSSRYSSPVTACALEFLGSALLMRSASCCCSDAFNGVVVLP